MDYDNSLDTSMDVSTAWIHRWIVSTAWIHRWMCQQLGYIDGCVNSLDTSMDCVTGGYIDGCVNIRIRWLERWIDRWMCEQTIGWIDEWMNGCVTKQSTSAETKFTYNSI
eukprot:254461-Amorphochlora_amoeboformis.AAC.1